MNLFLIILIGYFGMLTPHEVFVKKIVPNIKAIIAIKLIKEKGETQIYTSKLLGVTQAAVSQYLSKGMKYYIEALKNIGLEESFFLIHIDHLIGELKSTTDLICFFNELWSQLINTRKLCLIHRKLNILVNNCSVCIVSQDQPKVDRERKLIIREIEAIASLIARIPELKILASNYYIRIARALPNPRRECDVAIYSYEFLTIKGQMKIKPMFTSKHHLANLLIKVNKLYPHILAVIDIKSNERIEAAIKNAKIQYINAMITPENGEDSIIKGIINVLGIHGFKPVIFNKAKGLEFKTYIFGRDLFDVLDKLFEIARGLKN